MDTLFAEILDQIVGGTHEPLAHRKIRTDMLILFEKFLCGIMSEMTVFEKDQFMRVFKKYQEKQARIRRGVEKFEEALGK